MQSEGMSLPKLSMRMYLRNSNQRRKKLKRIILFQPRPLKNEMKKGQKAKTRRGKVKRKGEGGRT